MTHCKRSILTYERGRRRPWRRIALRVFVLLLIGAVGVAAWKIGPAALEHEKYLSLQRQCMEWSVPPGTVAIELESTRVSQLLADPEYLPLPATLTKSLSDRKFPAATFAMRRMPAVGQILPFPVDGPSPYAGIVFMHRLHSPGGHERLVVVASRVGPAINDGFWWDFSEPIVMIPAPVWPPEKLKLTGEAARPPSGRGPLFTTYGAWDRKNDQEVRHISNLRIYAGQADPDDTSHFSIRYEYLRPIFASNGKQTGEEWVPNGLQGWLQDDDTVLLKKDHAGGRWENLAK